MMALQILAIALLLAQSSSTQAPALDYSFFKERVQPIFLKKRPGHARCGPALQETFPHRATVDGR